MSEVKPYLVTMKNDFDPNKPKYMLLIISAYNAKDAVQQAKIERKKFDKHHTYIGVKFEWVYEYKVFRVDPKPKILIYSSTYNCGEEQYNMIKKELGHE